jgi:hypothetical protein
MSLFKSRRENPFIYLINFPDKERVVFKILKWSEFKAYRSIASVYGDTLFTDIQEDIFTYCLLDMSYQYTTEDDGTKIIDWKTMPAGVVETVASLIYVLSGAADSDKLFYDLENGRYTATIDAEKQILSSVSMLTKLKPEDYDNMYWPDIVSTINQSEMLMLNNMPVPPFRPAVEEDTRIDFDKENAEDFGNGVAANIIEQRKQQTRERRRQLI